MESDILENSNIVSTIIQTINAIFNNLSSSIDNNVYAILDDITFIDKDILNDNIINNFLGKNGTIGLIVIANALVIGLSIYYATRLLFSTYTGAQVEKPYQFIFKLLMITVGINFSYFLCEQVLNINFLLSASIREVGEKLLNSNISFEQLILKNNLILTSEAQLNVFSFDGIIKSFTSFSLFNLVFSYALRYIMVKVFILLTPFAFVTLLNNNTSWIFKSWLKSLFSLLIVQSFIAIILLIVFSIDFSINNTFSKILYVGSIYALIKANSYTKQIIGGISTEVSSGMSGLKKIIK